MALILITSVANLSFLLISHRAGLDAVAELTGYLKI